MDVKKTIQREFSERKRVEEALRRHLQMLDFAEDTIMIRDLRDCIVYWNQVAVRHYGWTKEEALGKNVHTFLKTVFPRPLHEVRRVCLREGYWEGELRHTTKNGSKVIVSSRWTLQRDEKGKPIAFLEINNDITKLKEAEDALREAHDQLERRVEERTAELKAANEKLRRAVLERRRLEGEILKISGAEQRRIGQDLHDGLSQLLTGIAFMGKVLERKLEDRSISEADHARKMVALVNEAIEQARGLARGLYPVELESNGLMSALQELVSNTEKVFHISCRFDCRQPILIDDHEVATHLYRIAQEAVNNAVKHSKTSKISIALKSRGDKIWLEIRDEGIGFPKNLRGLKKSKGMGIRMMGYRAETIHATLNIHGDHGSGTTVSCSFPKRAIIKRHPGVSSS